MLLRRCRTRDFKKDASGVHARIAEMSKFKRVVETEAAVISLLQALSPGLGAHHDYALRKRLRNADTGELRVPVHTSVVNAEVPREELDRFDSLVLEGAEWSLAPENAAKYPLLREAWVIILWSNLLKSFGGIRFLDLFMVLPHLLPYGDAKGRLWTSTTFGRRRSPIVLKVGPQWVVQYPLFPKGRFGVVRCGEDVADAIACWCYVVRDCYDWCLHTGTDLRNVIAPLLRARAR